MPDSNLALDQLRRHEGLRLKAYQDAYGNWTLGYGHMTGAIIEGDTCTVEQADQWLIEDYAAAVRGVEATLPELNSLHPVQKAVLRNMAFNMGVSRLLKFGKMLAAVRRGDDGMAAIEMLDSKWHREDVGQRAVELAKQMYTREWQDA